MKVYPLSEVAASILEPLGIERGERWLRRRISDGEIRGLRLSRSVFGMTQAQVDAMLDKFTTGVDPAEPAEAASVAPVSILHGLSARARRRIKGA